MLSAPFLAVYGTLLLVVAFISQLHLNHIDIFPTLPKHVLIDFDVYGYPVPCVHLAAKVCTTKSCDGAKQRVLSVELPDVYQGCASP